MLLVLNPDFIKI